jgi:hypothetical protein
MNNNFLISNEEIKKKEKKKKELLDKETKEIIITTELLTYEELYRRAKKVLPSLDESKTKTFLIEPFLYKKNETFKSNYYEREDYHFKK